MPGFGVSFPFSLLVVEIEPRTWHTELHPQPFQFFKDLRQGLSELLDWPAASHPPASASGVIGITGVATVSG